LSFDLVIGLLVLLFAVAGAFSGALKQLVKVAALAAGLAAARFASPVVAPRLLGAHPLPVERALTSLGCFAVAALAVGLLLGAVARRLHGPSGSPGATDRLMGAVLGAAKGAVLAWILLSLLALAHGRVKVGPIDIDPRGSATAAFAAEHNLLFATAPQAAHKVEQFLDLFRDPSARARLMEKDPALKKLIENPRFKALLERGAASPDKAKELLDDPEGQELLKELDRR
jgi:membrane protein required for colicin V production